MLRNLFAPITTVIFLIFLVLSTANADTGESESVRFARYPSPSPDTNTLAFSWAGDIWIVPINGGRAIRLTSSDGYDCNPIWSPDGSKIAFMSDRYGSYDLFVIDAHGGTPERITFASNGDLLSGWTADGNGLIFSTRRGGIWPDNREPHVVYFESDQGYGPSAPEKLVPSPGNQAVMHPDGDFVAFHFGPGNGYREGYTGTHKEDIWLYRISTGEFTRVTENRCSDIDPMWSRDGSVLYYRSEEELGVGNIWSWNLSTGEKTRITNLDETGLWHPLIAGAEGSEFVVYEWMGGIYQQALDGGNAREIRINAWLDEDPDTPRTLTMTSGASEFAMSPDGNEMAFVVRGEIFCVRADGVGGTNAAQLTNHPARDWEISWYPRGDAILFTSDRDGIEQLYRVISDDPEHERLSESRRFIVERLTHTNEPCWEAQIAPVPPDYDGLPFASELTIAYFRNKGDLWLMDGEGNHHRNLFSYFSSSEFTFSPDGRWLAYSRADEEYNAEIFIAAVDPDDPNLPPCPTEGWQPFPGSSGAVGLVPSWADGEVNITRHPDDDFMPRWSPDGSKLGFSSERNLDNTDAYFVFLQKQDEERPLSHWEIQAEPLPSLPEPPSDEPQEDEETEEIIDEEETETEAENGEEDTEKVEEIEEEEPCVVNIDFEGIHFRARRMTDDPGVEFLHGFSPDGEQILYQSNTIENGDIYQVKWDGSERNKVASGTGALDIMWHSAMDRIYYLTGGGTVRSFAPGGNNGENHNFQAAFELDPFAERMYKFDELWRIEDQQFYDPDFHGQDWDQLHEDYQSLVVAARHYQDFQDAVNLMLGRLNTSHLSYNDAGNSPPGPQTGYLGCGFIENSEPGLLIDRITPDTPIDHDEFGIQPGDRIVRINGQDVGGWGEDPVGNWWRAMEGTVGTEIEVGIIRQDSETEEPEWIRLFPEDYWGWYDHAYQAWLDDCNWMVGEISGGRLGYMHIPRMYEPNVERFEQDLYTVGHGRDGIIIDVRWNSGGWVTDYLLSILNTERHALTRPRDGGLGYPEDRTAFYTYTGPLVVMVNQYSYSNAEIFAHAIKNLGRGALVGIQTGGGVISTGGTRLADGSYLSLPRRGWWAIDMETGEPLFNLEGNGAIPDVEVDLLPPDFAEGIDPQLIKATETLMIQLGLRQ